MKYNTKTHAFIQNDIIHNIIFIIKLIIVFSASFILIIIKYFFDLLFPKAAILIPGIFHKLIVWFINIKITQEGKITKSNNGLLIVSNHISYLDIPRIGSLINGKFIAKAEVSTWPLFGSLAKIGNTIFIKRLKNSIYKEKNYIQEEIDKGINIILFPEGTTSDGIRILNFKSSLLSSVEYKNYLIQPIVIHYSGINGMPLNRWSKPIIAWYGDMELIKHLYNLVQLFSITVSVSFLEPVFTKDFKDRKSITFALQNVIYTEYSEKINGN